MNESWLSQFLRKLSPWQGGLIFLGVNLIGDVLLAYCFGSLRPGLITHGLIAEPMAWSSDILIPSILMGYLVWIQNIPGKVFNSLAEEKVLKINHDVENEIDKSRSFLSGRWPVAIALVVSLAAGIGFALSIPVSNPLYTGWVGVSPVLPWLKGALTMLTVYVGVVFLIDVFVFLRTLRRVLESQEIVMRPFHVDGAGGLGIIGKVISGFSFLVGAFGLHVSVSLLSNTLPAGISTFGTIYVTKISGLIGYIILAPLFFFVPLYSGHRAMVRWRNKLLVEWERRIEKELGTLRENRESQLKEEIEKMESLQKAYSSVEAFPVWPFNKQNVKKYFTVVTGSIIPGSISVIMDIHNLTK